MELDVRDGRKTKRVVFSGDLGRKHMPILRDPEVPERADLLLLESTYGDRLHPPREEMDAALGEIVRKSEIYLAASKDLPDAEAQKWERAFEAVKADGTYQRIADEYNRLKIVPIPDEMRLRFSQPVWEGR